MAENLIGAPLEPSIVKQLEERSKRLSQAGIRTGTDIRYLGQKNAWVRLSSFTGILSSGTKLIATNTNNEINIPSGIELAKQWALRGEWRGTGDLKFGASKGNGAYGSGGVDELGYRPLPGITGVTVESQPPAGAIRTASIKIKALTLNQLSILDVLYFRLGFSMLLEWGHSIYTDNKGRLINGPVPIDAFAPGLTKEGILTQLSQKRLQSSHNYDGLLGLVTNYDWTQAGDGSYDCTLKLSGIGSIVESLKINTQDATLSSKPTATPPAPAPQETTNTTTDPATATTVQDSALGGFLSIISNSYAIDLINPEYFPGLFAKGLNLLSAPTPAFNFGYSRSYMSGKGGPQADLSALTFFIKASIKKVDDPKEPSTVTDARFIPLATLLAFLNNSCIIYDKSNNQKKPAIYIDFNQETNLCLRIPQQFSVDPGVCIASLDCTDEDYNKLFTVRGIDIAKITAPSSPVNGKLHTNILQTSRPTYTVQDKPFVGRFMNIFVNVDCLRQTMTEVTDENKNIYLGAFLTSLMQKIQVAMGNINNFKVGYDDTANVIMIYDAQLVDAENRLKAIPTLPVFGLTSSARSYSLKTEASTKIGSMLAITARAGARNTGANVDSTAFTALNANLYDRLFVGTSTDPKKDAPPDGGSETEESTTGIEALGNSFNQQISSLYEISTNNITYNAPAVDSIKQFYIASMLLLKGGALGEKTDSVAATGILPLSLNLTLDGIGGVPLYQAFTIPANRLPAQYVLGGKPRVGFSVMGLSHQIENNEWTTTIRANMINLPAGKRVYVPGVIKNPSVTTRTVDTEAPNPSTTVSVAGTVTRGGLNILKVDFPKSQYLQQVYPKTQIYLHHTAGNSSGPGTFQWWATTGEQVATCVAISGKGAVDGQVVEGFESKYWAAHLGLKTATFQSKGLTYKPLDRTSIGIEICNYGQLTLKNGKYYNYVGGVIPANDVIDIVTPYKGYRYFQNYTDAQIESVRKLLLLWKQEHGIPLTYKEDIWDISVRALRGDPGVYTHNSVRTDKIDVYPHPKLIQMLRSL